MASVLEDLEHTFSECLSPDEPHAVKRRIKLLQRSDYQGRIWATRQRPRIDRLASAWLIRRFIDLGARFIWFAIPEDYPSEAPGFDFDGAAFTHTGAKVTFEVLLASFGLTQDAPLNRSVPWCIFSMLAGFLCRSWTGNAHQRDAAMLVRR